MSYVNIIKYQAESNYINTQQNTESRGNIYMVTTKALAYATSYLNEGFNGILA